MKKLTTLMAAMALLALSASPLYARAVNCDSPNPVLADLQDAIDEADVGAELTLSGTCEGPFFITKNISLRGPATLSAPGGGFAVLRVERGGHATLRDLNIDASGADEMGIAVRIGGTAHISNIVVEGAATAGIRVLGTSQATINDSEFRNNQSGIVVTIASSVLLSRNTIEDNNVFGVIVTESSSGGLFSGNVIRRNDQGVWVDSSASLQISGSTITNNTTTGVGSILYGFVNLFGTNTIENNGTDIRCNSRAGFRATAFQTSATETESISGDCLIDGVIFDPAP